MKKREALRTLAERRKADHWIDSRRSSPPGFYRNLNDYHEGAYECDFVSPYTKSACNEEAKVLLMLLDWSSDEVLSLPPVDLGVVRYGRQMQAGLPGARTNFQLDRLVLEHLGVSIEKLYATNLFPFIKPGRISGPIPPRDLERAGREYALPQIEIIQPHLVVALGTDCYNALRRAATGMRHAYRLPQVISTPFEWNGIRFWGQAHPAVRSINRTPSEMENDWREMAAWLNSKYPNWEGATA